MKGTVEQRKSWGKENIENQDLILGKKGKYRFISIRDEHPSPPPPPHGRASTIQTSHIKTLAHEQRIAIEKQSRNGQQENTGAHERAYVGEGCGAAREVLNQFYSRKTSPYNAIRLIQNISSPGYFGAKSQPRYFRHCGGHSKGHSPAQYPSHPDPSP